MDDPYVWPATSTLINKENIRDPEEFETFERVMTANRLETLPAGIPITAEGYRRIHRFIFQDVYDWAGQYRTVNIAKGNAMFCLVPHIASQLRQRFAAIRAERGLKGLTRDEFAGCAAEHICEINAIHPFRDGNGRTLRAFLERLGEAAGHSVDLKQIDPATWNAASISSFQDATYDTMRQLILGTLIEPALERKRARPRPAGQGPERR
jgi:cell filamentation protein